MILSKAELEQVTNSSSHETTWYQNCAGFAFNVQAWYEPAGNSQEEIFENYYKASKSKNWEMLEEICVNNILHDFPVVEIPKSVIDNVEITDFKHNVIIAFRIRKVGFLCDFHVMKTDPEGNWVEKCGHEPQTYSYKYEDIYESKTWGEYNGTIKFFLLQKEDHHVN